MHYWLSEIIVLGGLIVALVLGRQVWSRRKKALFPKLVSAGLGCMALGCLHDTLYLLVTGNYASEVYIGYLGVIGCFMFLVSANYGQLDGLFDERGKENRKYRILALVGPVLISLTFIPSLFSDQLTPLMKILDYMGWLPITVASYYNMKHAILPDNGFSFVNAVRPYNVTAVLLGLAEVLYLTMYTAECIAGVLAFAVAVAVLSVALMVFAKRGAEKWTI